MLATELPSFYLSMGGKGGKKFGPRRKGCAKFKPGPNKLGKPRRWPPRKVAAKKVAKKKVAAKKVANQNDDDQVDTGESNAPAAENPNDAVQVEAVAPARSCRSRGGCGKIFCFVCYPE